MLVSLFYHFGVANIVFLTCLWVLLIYHFGVANIVFLTCLWVLLLNHFSLQLMEMGYPFYRDGNLVSIWCTCVAIPASRF